jgi:hypothetical protein
LRSQADNALLEVPGAYRREEGPRADKDQESKLVEGDFQSRTIAKFEGYGWIVIRLNAGKAYGPTGNPIRLAPKGSVDIAVLVPGGELVLVELKQDKNTLEYSQKRMHIWYNFLGHKVITAYTDEQLDKYFARYSKPGYKAIRELMDKVPVPQKRIPKDYVRLEDWLEEGA